LAAQSHLPIFAEEATTNQRQSAPHGATKSAGKSELDAAFANLLSGATLEGSFTRTGQGADMTKLSREKYTLGDVKKLAGDLWLIQARIEYGEHDVTLPLTLPVKWAGDTPMIVIDKMEIPGFGVVSARVMFFDGHYAGYWKHGDHGGHLFGIIQPPEKEAAMAAPDRPSLPRRHSSAREKKNQ
jgi:hypothetical protein